MNSSILYVLDAVGFILCEKRSTAVLNNFSLGCEAGEISVSQSPNLNKSTRIDQNYTTDSLHIQMFKLLAIHIDFFYGRME